MFGLLQNIQKTFKNESNSESNASSMPSDETRPQNSSNKLNEISSNASAFAEKLADYAKLASNVAQKHAGKLSTILNENSVFGELDRQNQSFKQELQQKSKISLDDVVLPWEGMPNADIFCKHILALSLEERNFLSEAPSDEILQHDHKLVAKKLLEIDSRLAEMRYKIVPKRISEENFWKNYFYRVSVVKKLIMEKQKNGGGDTQSDNAISSANSLNDGPTSSQADRSGSKKVALKDVKKSVREDAEEDWENELLKDIGEFELIGNSGQKSDAEWDAEISAMLAAEAESVDKSSEETLDAEKKS